MTKIGRPRTPWAVPFHEVRRRYEAGESAADIARDCGLKSYHPVIIQLREAGVEIRKPGGAKRKSPRPQIVVTCKNPECAVKFTKYRSSHKKYCSPRCRYSNPEIADLMANKLSGKHKLSDIDEVARTAHCAVCGPVAVRERKEARKHSERRAWRCRLAEQARKWAYTYGLTAEEILARLHQQEESCAICKVKFHETFYIDHCHETMTFRGILCNNCNRGLGFLGDTVTSLEAAVQYLRAAAVGDESAQDRTDTATE